MTAQEQYAEKLRIAADCAALASSAIREAHAASCHVGNEAAEMLLADMIAPAVALKSRLGRLATQAADA